MAGENNEDGKKVDDLVLSDPELGDHENFCLFLVFVHLFSFSSFSYAS